MMDKKIRTTWEKNDNVNSVYSYFTDKPIVVTKQKKERTVIIDYDKNDNIVGVEVLWYD